jgi:hypothetical protein
LGKYRRTFAAAGFCVLLGNNWQNMGLIPAAGQKNFANSENFVCIWGKMGYNRVE